MKYNYWLCLSIFLKKQLIILVLYTLVLFCICIVQNDAQTVGVHDANAQWVPGIDGAMETDAFDMVEQLKQVRIEHGAQSDEYKNALRALEQ